jgi:Raf kinase inhibitor-like YbhB/YbcL family protein
VKQPPFTWELSGSWTYLSFHNDPEHVYRGKYFVGFAQKPQPTADELILQEAYFRLQTPTSTTLQGTVAWLGGPRLDLTGTIRPGVGGEPSSFQMTGIGNAGESNGWEYRYYGHLTRTWPRAVDQRPALVGSIIRSNSHAVPTQTPTLDRPDGGLVRAAAGYVAPFIAVDAPFIEVKHILVRRLTLSSTAFQENDPIPSKYTNDGEAGVRDVSPPLAWENVPNGTRSLVLIMDDPDAPDPQAPEMVWVHWVVYNIPPNTRSLPENAARAGLPQGASHGLNDFARQDPRDPRATGYGGPNPPIGRHRYFHKLYALDIRLDLRDATKPRIEQAVRGHVLADTYLIGTYQRRSP